MNSSFVGHGSKFMLDVDKFPGAVDALCFSDSFVDSLIERWRFSIFVSCKDETVFLVFDGTALEARSWFSLANSFWLSSKNIFLCIRFRITDGFLLPKNRSSTFKQPFFLSRSMLSIKQIWCVNSFSSVEVCNCWLSSYKLSDLKLSFCFPVNIICHLFFLLWLISSFL